MKPTTKSNNLDKALLDLVVEGAKKYEISTKSAEEIDSEHVDELFDLSMDVLGDNNRNQMQMMPKEKKLTLVKQLLVLDANHSLIKNASQIVNPPKIQPITRIC